MHKHHVTIKMSLKTFIKNLVSFRKLSLRQNAVQISHISRGSFFLRLESGWQSILLLCQAFSTVHQTWSIIESMPPELSTAGTLPSISDINPLYFTLDSDYSRSL